MSETHTSHEEHLNQLIDIILNNEDVKISEIVSLTDDDLNTILAKMSEHSIAIIEKAYKNRKIDSKQYKHLKQYFSDPDKVYRQTYRAIYNLFKQPEATQAIDLSTGKVEKNEQGRPINYTLRAVTPFTNTQLVYYDKFHNPIRIIFPKMKGAKRAIDKIIYEYGKEYNQALVKISDLAFVDEDREAYADALQMLPTPETQLRDILRLTITCKYKTDVERISNVIQKGRTIYTLPNEVYKEKRANHTQTSPDEEKRIKKNEPYYIIAEEKRNRFDGKIKDNSKMYYDIKLVMYIPDENGIIRAVELQLKIHTLYMADVRTHKIYEEVRAIEKELEKKASSLSAEEKNQLIAKKKILNHRIAQINKNAIHQYNMMVVDKIRRIEEDGYIPLRAAPEYADGTYQECRDFLFKEYMPESLNDFNAKEAFDPSDDLNKMCFLRMIGKLEPNFDEFSPTANTEVEEAFKNLTPAEMHRFTGIYQVSNRYSQIIQNAINEKRTHDGVSDLNTLNIIKKKKTR